MAASKILIMMQKRKIVYETPMEAIKNKIGHLHIVKQGQALPVGLKELSFRLI